MTGSFLDLRRAVFVGAAVLTVALTLEACSSSGTSPLATGGRAAAPATSGYTFYYPIDNPSGQPNFITGIDHNRKIVGVYGTAGSSNPYNSYTAKYQSPSPSQSPYPTFVNDNYPDAPGGTYMSGIVSQSNAKSLEAGYAITPGGYNGNLNGNWGVVDNKGIWTLIAKHPNPGGPHCHHLELFGIDSNFDAVGLYWHAEGTYTGECSGSNKTQYAFEVSLGETSYTDFKKLNLNYGATAPVATGIYESGSTYWVVGSTDSTGASSNGWTTTDGKTFHLYTYSNSGRSTQFLGLNSAGAVVGTEEGAGSDWHGFTVTGLFQATPNPVWSSLIDLGNNEDTVVSGVNDLGDICGWYKTSDGTIHGFVGIHQ